MRDESRELIRKHWGNEPALCEAITELVELIVGMELQVLSDEIAKRAIGRGEEGLQKELEA